MEQNIYEIKKIIESFKSNLKDFLHSGSYYITEEIGEETRAILNGLESLNLDSLFLANAPQWSNELDRTQLRQEQKTVLALLVQGEVMMQELKTDLNVRTIRMQREDDVRRAHYNARARLRAFLQSLNPYSFGAYARLENFSDHIGASDRYSNYRRLLIDHEKNPMRDWSVWPDCKRLPEAPKFITPNWRDYTHIYNHHERPLVRAKSSVGYKKENTEWPNTNTQVTMVDLSTQNCQTNNSYNNQNSSYNKKTNDQILIENGRNPIFPGRSEYSHSFEKPKEEPYAPFTINPQPDTSRFNRPFTSIPNDPRHSEYKVKYVMPDSSKIDRFPWIKKNW